MEKDGNEFMLDSGEGAHDTEFHTLFHLHEVFFFLDCERKFSQTKTFSGVKIDFFSPYGDGDFGRVEDVRIAPKTNSEVTHEDEGSEGRSVL